MNDFKIKPLVFTCLLLVTLTTSTSFSTAKTNERIVLIPKPKSNETTSRLLKSLQKWDELQLKIAQECEDIAIDNNPNLKKEKVNEFYKLSYSVLINNNSWYSVSVKTDRYCGGPYPSIDKNVVVFNKKSGSKIDPIDLYNITEKTKNGYTIKPAVASLIRSALLREIDKGSIQKSCLTVIKEDTIEFLDQDTVGLGKNGLYIMYTGPHVVASCYKTIVLPYPQLSRFLNQAEAKKLNWNYSKLMNDVALDN